MKQCLQDFSNKLQANGLAFINKHPEVFCLSLLAFLCLIFLFFGLGSYPLIDVDETRYAVMARDLVNSWSWDHLYLNGVPFLEKPPLYFWLVAGSIKTFGQFSEFAVRFPIALLASFVTFFTYFVGKKVLTRTFGMISAITLLSSIFFLILSHVAILDMVLTVFVASALYCGFLSHFSEDKYKKYCWWYFYIFAALGFLAKGILAIAIPFTVIFLYNLAVGKLKEVFKPVNIIPGVIFFIVAIAPWHLIMYADYGNRFIKEYFLVHHFARFIDSAHIGRERPFYYFIPVFLLGFLPWSLAFIAFTIEGVKKLIAKYKAFQGTAVQKIFAVFDAPTNEQKLILFATIYFVVTFLVFSSSSTKLPTYILPAFPAAALLTGFFWWAADKETQEEKSPVGVITIIFAATIILASFVTTFGFWFLPYEIQKLLSPFEHLTLLGLYMLGIFLLLRLRTKRALAIFSGHVFVMIFIIFLAVSFIFKLIYNGGQNEIAEYSGMAQINNAKLVTFDFAVKPSAMINYRGRINYITDPDFEALEKAISDKGQSTFVIVKNVNLEDKEYVKKLRHKLTMQRYGEKYSLYVKDNNNIFKVTKRCCLKK